MDLPDLLASLDGVIDRDRVRLGVAAPQPFPEVHREIERRTVSGERGGLGFVYRDAALATEPTRSFPWASAIVVVAVGYLRDGDGLETEGARSVARFADGDRYEDLERVLGRLTLVIEEAGHRAVPVWDDDRLVDRAVAIRSGIAWWGKSTMAITPGLGPWFLIGSVVTDADMAPTEPMQRTCGTCIACLPACPTGAFVEPGILDARRCLAAILQGRGSIPRTIRPSVGARIYGCDDCLTACPPGHGLLRSMAPGSTMGPRDVLEQSDDVVMAAIEHWYVPGRRSRFVRRNALVALGNTGGNGDLPLLAGYLGHPDELLRSHAAWAVGSIGGPVADAILAAAERTESDPDVLEEIRWAAGSSAAAASGERPPTIAP